jgi:hypothetical protein
MGNIRTRRPASDPRPARRSLAELTEAAGRAADLRATAADGEVLEQWGGLTLTNGHYFCRNAMRWSFALNRTGSVGIENSQWNKAPCRAPRMARD